MPVSTRVSGTWRTVTQPYVRVSGTWRACQIYVRVSGTWKQVSETLSVSLDTTSVLGAATAPGAAVTTAVTATPSGGAGGYSYAWEYVSGDNSINCNSPSTAATSFTRSSGSAGSFQALWRCKVTDSNGDIAFSANVTVTTNFT